MLKGVLIGGVVPWGAAFFVMIALLAVMEAERAGIWVWRVGVVSAAASASWTVVGLARHWTASICFDRSVVAVIVGLANVIGLFVTYVMYVLMVAAGV